MRHRRADARQRAITRVEKRCLRHLYGRGSRSRVGRTTSFNDVDADGLRASGIARSSCLFDHETGATWQTLDAAEAEAGRIWASAGLRLV
jgi:hypothetical protein